MESGYTPSIYNGTPCTVRSHVAVKALFKETNTYNDLVRRPYTANNIDGYIYDDFNSCIQSNKMYSSNDLASFSNRLLRTSIDSTENKNASIVNGWGVRRFLFTIEIISDVSGNINVYPERIILNGYSDYDGATANGSVDPKMQLYFNSVVLLRKSVTTNGYRTFETITPTNISHILELNQYSDNTNRYSPSDNIFLMRPYDIALNIDENYQTPNLAELNIRNEDTRSMLSVGGLSLSSRENNIASKYLENTFSSLHKAYNCPDNGMDSAYQDTVYGKAALNLKENSATSLAFFRDLLTNTTYSMDGFVTYSDMCKLIPNFNDTCTINISGPVTRIGGDNFNGMPQRGQSCYWTDCNQETMIANIISVALPSLMMQCMISTIQFSATNRTIDGSYCISVESNSIRMFSESIEPDRYVQHFIDRCKREILNDVTNSNTLELNINVHARSIEDTWIQVSLMGNPAIDYVVPSFADVLISPIIAADKKNLDSLSFTLGSLFDGSVTKISTEDRNIRRSGVF